ncbi:MAG TPA: hypothetical protein VGE74_03400 [Gemmata sp.]
MMLFKVHARTEPRDDAMVIEAADGLAAARVYAALLMRRDAEQLGAFAFPTDYRLLVRVPGGGSVEYTALVDLDADSGTWVAIVRRPG